MSASVSLSHPFNTGLPRKGRAIILFYHITSPLISFSFHPLFNPLQILSSTSTTGDRRVSHSNSFDPSVLMFHASAHLCPLYLKSSLRQISFMPSVLQVLPEANRVCMHVSSLTCHFVAQRCQIFKLASCQSHGLDRIGRTESSWLGYGPRPRRRSRREAVRLAYPSISSLLTSRPSLARCG